MQRNSSKPVAYSYIRFSTPEQAKGDSLRRQTERAESYCKARGWSLDASLTLQDLGVSAFRGDNAMVGNLGVFLDAVKRGKVMPGSALIVESVDRISRQGIDEGYDLCKSILKAGIHIVTLSPERDFGPDAVKSLSRGALELQLILERAAEESERKSDRVGAAWGRKKEQAKKGKVMTKRLPGWITEKDGKLMLIRERAAIVKEIFRLAAAGYGISSILKKLIAEEVPSFGRTGIWTRSYLALILRDRRAVGDHLPTTRGKRDAKPIPKYYPPAIAESEWLAARAGARERDRCATHTSTFGNVNIFSGLLRHARDGDSYMMTTRVARSTNGNRRRFHALVNRLGDECRGRAYSIPYLPFETAILKKLREIDPHDILNGDHPPDSTTALSLEHSNVEAELAEARAFMDKNGFSPTIGERIVSLEARQRDLAADLADARHEAAHPISETWGELQSLADVLDKATDKRDCRLRMRSALRRVTKDIRLLIVRRGVFTIASAQFWFAGEKERERSYLIVHRRATRHNPELTCPPLDFAGIHQAGELDLRKRGDARKAEKLLEAVDLEALLQLMEKSE